MRTLTLTFLLAAGLTAQQPRVSNAHIENRTLSGAFLPAFQQLVASQSSPAWIGYSVRMLPGREQMCCWDSSHPSACALEPEGRRRSAAASPVGAPTPVKLEGPRWMSVLFRVENGAIGKVRAFGEDCPLDAGGLPLIWLSSVGSRDSLALLSSQTDKNHDVFPAIAFHEDPEADRVLETLASPNRSEKMRGDAAFWLATARGHHGYEVVQRIASTDPSDEVRTKAVFALSVSNDPQATPALILIARQDKSEHVRGQAIFWLAQKAGRKETEAIRNAIDNDPSTEVKKKAVFALQQLPGGEGVPLLIQVATQNSNPEVRKQAMFWLGQTHDPRAVAFFEQILMK